MEFELRFIAKAVETSHLDSVINLALNGQGGNFDGVHFDRKSLSLFDLGNDQSDRSINTTLCRCLCKGVAKRRERLWKVARERQRRSQRIMGDVVDELVVLFLSGLHV